MDQTNLTVDDIETALQLEQAIMNSSKRAAIFYHFANGVTANYKLADRADCSRQTVSEAFNEFEEFLLIDEDREELTEVGEILADQVIPFFEKGYAVQHLSPFIQQLQSGSNKPLFESLDRFRSAEVVEEGETDRERPLRKYRELVQSADHIRELVPFRTPVSNDFYQKVVNGELSSEFVVADNVMDEALSTDETARIIQEMGTEGATYYVYDESKFPGYTLTIADREAVGLVASDSEYVFVQSTDSEMLEWAENIYDQICDAAIGFEEYC